MRKLGGAFERMLISDKVVQSLTRYIILFSAGQAIQATTFFNGVFCLLFTHSIILNKSRDRNRVLSAQKFVDNINYEDMELVKIGEQHVRVEMDHLHGHLISYWSNTVDGLKALTEYVINLFNIDVSDIWASKQSFHMIEWVNSRQKTPLRNVWYADWSTTAGSEEDMIYILKDCRTISQLRICLKLPPNFRFSEKFRKIDCLDIWYGEWVTIDNLLTMDGIVIILKSSTLTSSDVNVFLKHWLSGGCPRLKLFSAEIRFLDILQVLADLLHNAVLVDDHRDYVSPFGYSINLSSGYDIRRADGVTATVCEQENGTMVFAGWPEITHNYN
ncbi:hypothetical protein CRE_16495 [Caenorhabditis remanei]|uniref:Sdz-33 F-box domain-containing protein n=1 Tax=Caenorhabditis remanei TaxID=31234 RepID=E3NM76_CAERE|nr:hypothetical protein CRE_16495 [Caenorhabditis remanei]